MTEYLILTCLSLGIAALLYRKKVARRQPIATSTFPNTVREGVATAYPHLSPARLDHVLGGLRTFFEICSVAKGRMVAMPSRAVDVAWHEFIVCTREYHWFCRSTLGRFLHHTPTEGMSGPLSAGAN